MPKFPNASFRSIAITISLAGMLAGSTVFISAPAAADMIASHHFAHHSHKHPARHHAPRKRASHKKRHARWKVHPKGHRTVHRKARPRIRPRTPMTPQQLARKGRWHLDIPGIGVTSRLLSLGDPRGPVLSVPALSQASEAAWYNFSAVPGAPGNSVLVGHVDTYTGPAVFYDLYRLEHGDPIYVFIGGRRERFAVQGVTEVQKDLFPVNRIFGATSSRHLWIITCGGAFDYTTRHYEDNIIVSASYQPVRRNHRH